MNKIQETEPTPGTSISGVRTRQDSGQNSSPLAANMDAAASSVGRGMDRAGEAIASAGKSAGAGVSSAGQYLQNSDPASMRSDFLATMGRHPGATLAIGLGVGLLLARLLQTGRTQTH